MKYQYVGKIKFTRDEKTGYYLNSTIRKRMHRYVYEQHHGAIPDGMHVHHINGDRADNRIENLELKLPSDHHKHHWEADHESKRKKVAENAAKAMIAAREWHKSPEGLKWHTEHGHKTWDQHPVRKSKCAHCRKEFEYKCVTTPKFCSGICKSANRRLSQADTVERDCPVCGIKYKVNKYSKAKSCSRACGWKLRK